jgi:hypothetical protein
MVDMHRICSALDFRGRSVSAVVAVALGSGALRGSGPEGQPPPRA